MEQTFNLKVFDNRHGFYQTYRLKKIDTGWHVAHHSISGNCEPDGKLYLYSNFDQDEISYPSDIGDYLEHLWGLINEDAITHEDAQKKMNEISEWLIKCEQAVPKWEDYN